MSALADRLAVSKLVLHPVKTKIVYCKDANRRGDFPIISLDFLGFQFRARTTIWNGKAAHGFMPPASPKALTATSRTVRRWSLHHRSDKSLQELAEMYNPCIRGWITYYSHFYKTRLRPALKRIDTYVIRWARRKFKRMRHQTKGARDWLDRLHRANPSSSPTGHYVMATAEHREPCESRGSCTVLGAPGGETPPGDSTCVTSASSRILAALNCTRDEGGPFEFGNQVLISSHRKLLRSRAGVVSVAETPGR